MLETQNNYSLPGESVLPGQGWVLLLEPFGLCKHSDHKHACLLSGKRLRAPYTRWGSRELDDEAPLFLIDWEWRVLGNQSSLMNKGMNQIESLPYEIMSFLVCPHSIGKSSFFLFPLTFSIFSSCLLSLFPHERFLCGGQNSCQLFQFSIASKIYSSCKQEARCVWLPKGFSPHTLVPDLAYEERASREQASLFTGRASWNDRGL